ncbi:response regulator [Rudanella lutea]|uniref:response regulator n=1 Tax=Rudanella lutea TaxID=451374 RepID=UPI0003672FF4|nr:response regulator [Rudanella lutea]
MTLLKNTVVVVDDDSDDQFLIRNVFQQTNSAIKVVTLSDGDEVLPYLNAQDGLPELMLLDLNMARLNGLQTLSQLRQEKRFDALPIIIYTTSSNAQERAKALASGASDFITKPGDYTDLIKLAQHLETTWLSD